MVSFIYIALYTIKNSDKAALVFQFQKFRVLKTKYVPECNNN